MIKQATTFFFTFQHEASSDLYGFRIYANFSTGSTYVSTSSTSSSLALSGLVEGETYKISVVPVYMNGVVGFGQGSNSVLATTQPGENMLYVVQRYNNIIITGILITPR